MFFICVMGREILNKLTTLMLGILFIIDVMWGDICQNLFIYFSLVQISKFVI